MTRFERFTKDTPPNESKPMLETVRSRYGFVPNLIEGLAVSPHTLEGYLAMSGTFENSSLTPEEQQIVLLTASRFNECEYCTSVHSVTAEATDLEWSAIERIRNEESLANERYEALRQFVLAVIRGNGTIPEDGWTEFRAAGFDERNALDVVLGVSLKTLTNTVNHLIDTPLDEQFQTRRWSVEAATAASV